MPIKVDANSTGFPVGINNNAQEPGKTNVHKLHNDQYVTAPEQIDVYL